MPASVSNFQRGAALDRLTEYVANPRPALVAIGALLKAKARASFREQQRGGIRWKPRNVPNIAGIIADLSEGRTPPMRRLDPRPALIDVGTLRDSIDFRVTSKNTVEVGTTLPYARVHNFGGETTQNVTQVVKDRLRELIKHDPWDQYVDRLEIGRAHV